MNRVSFLRTDHPFLTAALKHPTTSFLIFNKLNPLTKTPSELAYASYSDVKPLIGEDPYKNSEEELIQAFNSQNFIPQLVFLGLDDRNKDGIVHKQLYKGAPYFALDVTPQGPLASTAEEVIKTFESRGQSFTEGRMHLSLPPLEGSLTSRAGIATRKHAQEVDKGHSCHLRRSPPSARLELAKPVLRAVRPAHHVGERWFQARVSAQGLEQTSRRCDWFHDDCDAGRSE